MTLEELELLVRDTPDPAALFGDDRAASLKRFRIVCHPDRFPGEPDRAARATDLMRRIEQLYRDLVKPTVIRSPRRAYEIASLLASGDVADVYRATSEGKAYLLKCSRVREGAGMLAHEADVLTEILQHAATTSYGYFFPTLCESFPVRDGLQKRINVFTADPGFYTLEQVHERYPALEGRHLAWIFKRLLSTLGFAHRFGFVHGAVLPCHVLVHAEGHGLQLVGWGQSVRDGEVIRYGSAEHHHWYPMEVTRKDLASSSTDIFMAAKCMVYLAGGDLASGQFPAAVPPELARIFRVCLLEGPRMRPGDAWELHDEFDEVLKALYGPPKYVELLM